MPTYTSTYEAKKYENPFSDGPGKATDAQWRMLHKLSPADTMDELIAYLDERFQAGTRFVDVTRSKACEMVDVLQREAMR